MAFEVGNKAAVGANHKQRQIITQQLIAELQRAEGKRLRNIVLAIIGKAEEGDVPALKEVFDRVEGKVTQPVGGDKDNPITMTVTWQK